MSNDVQIAGAAGAAPQSYTVPNATEIIPRVVNATFDGTGAAASFLPTIEIVSDGGVVVARCPATTAVAAGGSAEVCFGPFLGTPAATTSSSGALTLITKTVLGANGNFSFTPIAGTFNDLLIVGVVRSTAVGNLDNVRMQFNGDTGATYAQQYVRGNAANLTAAGNDPVNQVDVSFCPGAGASANRYGAFQIWIPSYADSTHSRDKVGFALNGFARGSAVAQPDVFDVSYAWVNTAAITRVDIFALAAGGFLSGSECRLYGRT